MLLFRAHERELKPRFPSVLRTGEAMLVLAHGVGVFSCFSLRCVVLLSMGPCLAERWDFCIGYFHSYGVYEVKAMRRSSNETLAIVVALSLTA